MTGDDDATRLMVLDANGSREFTPAGKDVYDSAPDWSPDGRALAFARFTTRDERYRSSIVVRDLAGGTERVLVTQRLFPRFGSVGEPEWSPDGSRILFTSDRNLPERDAAEVYSVAADGTCLTWLANGTPASGSATWRPASGGRFDPGSCGPAMRPALVDPPRLRPLRGGLWLGSPYRGLLLSQVGQGFIAYDDCARFTRCPDTIMLSGEPACRLRTFRGLQDNAYRYFRVSGALVAFYGSQAGARVLSGHSVTSVHFGGNTRLSAVRRVVRSLRPYRASEPPRRLAPPRIPRALRLEPGPLRRALRSFGRLRFSRC